MSRVANEGGRQNAWWWCDDDRRRRRCCNDGTRRRSRFTVHETHNTPCISPVEIAYACTRVYTHFLRIRPSHNEHRNERLLRVREYARERARVYVCVGA